MVGLEDEDDIMEEGGKEKRTIEPTLAPNLAYKDPPGALHRLARQFQPITCVKTIVLLKGANYSA